MYKRINSSNLEDFLAETLGDVSRLAIGFGPTFKRLHSTAGLSDTQSGYPPFNIEQLDENNYRIMLAVAGFTKDDLDITVAENNLVITGEIQAKAEPKTYVHKGIAERNFTRTFVLADHVNVMASSLEHGMLTVDLKREVPEALLPRKIKIADRLTDDANAERGYILNVDNSDNKTS
jgi:molecular chaperone IbpA